jgi:lysozyme family protein
MSFKRALAFVELQEGGWADDSHDRGGRTRYGIASASHPEVDLEALTREGAAAIFRAEYWDTAHCEGLRWPISLVVFDYAIHSGAARSVRALQGEIGTQADGRYGPQSEEAMRVALDARTPYQIALALVLRRLKFLTHGFRSGTFSPQEPLRFLGGFWKRTVELAYEVGRS